MVLQGVESDIDGNGYDVTINDGITSLRYVTVYYQVNLDENTTDIKYTTSTTGYPTISAGDDLTAITNGTANLELYHFQIQNGTISNVEKLVQPIVYSLKIIQDVNGVLKIGDVIIPQKKILWSGNEESSNSTLSISVPSLSDKTVEVKVSIEHAQGYQLDYWLKFRINTTGVGSTSILAYTKPTVNSTIDISELSVGYSGNTFNISNILRTSSGDIHRLGVKVTAIYEIIE